MIRTGLLLSVTISVALAGAARATQQTYTQLPGGANTVALGYPVPLPVDSLTPVAGFRSYASLHARHQQLTADSLNVEAVALGTTINGRPVWAYVLSDPDASTQESLISEGGMLQNGGIHAREWQSPEVLTGIFETLVENEADQGLHQYLLENARIVLIPVLNVDGFLQTQRYPSQFMRSTYSGDPSNWPRDGRMRRKNMRAVDEDLDTETDNLFGVDLNRNNAPWWASSNRSSTNSRSLVYHGSGPGSEPETQALQNAVNLFAANQLRFYIDTHSFSKLYFLSRNGNSRRDSIATQLGVQMAQATGNSYTVSPDPINSGMGTTDEYFAYTFDIPAYTLEIEPRDSSVEYGGFGVTHDGFILPANQIARVRTELTRASLLGYYHQSGAPTLVAAQIKAVDTDTVMAEQRWTPDSATSRQRTRADSNGWQIGVRYQLTLDFNKPMRVRDESGTVVNYQGQSISLKPTITLSGQHVNGNTVGVTLTAVSESWCAPPDCQHYDSDRYTLTFDWPATLVPADLINIHVGVSVQDLAGLVLDSQPASVMYWQDGHWQGYEDAFGVATDSGGTDRSFRIKSTGEPPQFNGSTLTVTIGNGQTLDFSFAADLFTDPEAGPLTYRLIGGLSAVPSWLQFDAGTRQLSGTASGVGQFQLVIEASDSDGNRSSAPLILNVTGSATTAGSSGGGGGSSGLATLILLGILGELAGWRRRHQGV